jgi:hypothetical protein
VAPLRARRVRQVPALTAVGKKAKPHRQSRKRQLVEQMLTEQQRAAEVLQSLATSVRDLELSSHDRLLEEIRRLLDDVLVAQHRTNHLLELALRAGFDDEEQVRKT